MLVNSDFWVWLYCESQYFMEAFAPSFIHSVTTHAKSSGTIRRQGSGEEQSSGPGDRRLDFGSNAVLPMSYRTSHLPFLGPCFLICRRRGYQETFTTCSISITWELVRHVRCDRALQNQNLHSCAQQHPKSTESEFAFMCTTTSKKHWSTYPDDFWWTYCANKVFNGVGQNIQLDLSISSYRKTQVNFLANPIK